MNAQKHDKIPYLASLSNMNSEVMKNQRRDRKSVNNAQIILPIFIKYAKTFEFFSSYSDTFFESKLK